MIKEKEYVDKYAVCDCCGNEVGKFQLGINWQNKKRHFCSRCWWVGLAVDDLESAEHNARDSHYGLGIWHIDYELLIHKLIVEAKNLIDLTQSKEGGQDD